MGVMRGQPSAGGLIAHRQYVWVYAGSTGKYLYAPTHLDWSLACRAEGVIPLHRDI